MNAHDLPIEIWQQIFAYLGVREKIHMVVADKYFEGVVDMAEINEAKARLFCEECNMATNRGMYEDGKCVDCYDGDSLITTLRAKSVFGLTKFELKRLPPAAEPRCDLCDPLYWFKPVRDAARKKYGKRMADVPCMPDSRRRRARVAQDFEEAEWSHELRMALTVLNVSLSDVLSLVTSAYLTWAWDQDFGRSLAFVKASICCERERPGRSEAIDARLDALGIAKDYYSKMREKYAKNMAGYRDLDRVVQIIVDTLELERSDADLKTKLERALGLRGIELRADSKLCARFLKGISNESLPSVVERMYEMHLLHQHTNYDACCDEAFEILREEECSVPVGDNMACVRDIVEDHCLAALGVKTDAAAFSKPLCRCGLSRQIVKSSAAEDFVDHMGKHGLPEWMEY